MDVKIRVCNIVPCQASAGLHFEVSFLRFTVFSSPCFAKHVSSVPTYTQKRCVMLGTDNKRTITSIKKIHVKNASCHTSTDHGFQKGLHLERPVPGLQKNVFV